MTGQPDADVSLKIKTLLLDQLQHQGWCMADDLLPADLAQSLLAEAQLRKALGQFSAAAVGRKYSRQLLPHVRNDTICWIDQATPYPASTAFSAWADQLRLVMNRHFFLGLTHLEQHFAHYEPGAGYAKHIDQHANTRSRTLSIILYLNPDWQSGHGGELCIYLPTTAQKCLIAPLIGRIVLFRSDTIVHAVLPCKTERWSLTGWFRNDAPPP